jgi:hypothetical protein
MRSDITPPYRGVEVLNDNNLVLSSDRTIVVGKRAEHEVPALIDFALRNSLLGLRAEFETIPTGTGSPDSNRTVP